MARRESSHLGYRNLHGLRHLRRLRLAGTEVRDLSCISGLSGLVHLDVSGTSLRDLSQIANLRSLETLWADSCPIRKLPKTELPTLRELRVMSTELNARSVAGFRQRNPQTRVLCGWNDALQDSLETATRVRVRTGGIDDREYGRDRVLVEERAPEQVRALVRGVVVREGRHAAGCRCNDGDLSVEFHDGDGYLLTLSLVHGKGIVWPEGWPGNQWLTAESTECLARWIEVRGSGRWEVRGDAGGRKRTIFAENLSPAMLEAVEHAVTSERAVRRLEESIPNRLKRAEIAFRLLGWGECSWDFCDGIDCIVIGMLHGVPSIRKKSRAVRGALDDPQVVRGLARWIFGIERPVDLKWQRLLPSIVPFAMVGITSPWECNRKATIDGLRRLSCKESTEILRSVLRGENEVREMPPDAEVEPAGWKWLTGSVGFEGSDRACAARALATLGDQSTAGEIARLASTADGFDREIYEEALETLRRNEFPQR